MDASGQYKDRWKTPIPVGDHYPTLFSPNEACGPIAVSGLTGGLNTDRLWRVGCISRSLFLLW